MKFSYPGRVAVAVVSLVVVPLLLIIDTVSAWAGGWSTANAMPLVVVGGSTALVLLVTAIALCFGGRRRLGAAGPRIAVLVASAALSWGLAEVAVAAVLGPRLWFHHYTPGSSVQFSPQPRYIHGINGTSQISFNSLGIRGDELPVERSVRRILCVGGSTTLCLYLDDTETWPALLQNDLNASDRGRYWVGNIGHNHYSTEHHTRFTRSAELMQMVDDVVFLVGINDLSRALQGSSVTAGGRSPLWWRSPILVTLHNTYQRISERGAEYDDDQGRAYEQRRAQRQAASFTSTLPDLSPFLVDYRANIREMIANTRRAGARPVFATQPLLCDANLSEEARELLWFGRVADGRALDAGGMRAGIELFNRALQAECAAAEVPCIDLSSLSGRIDVFYDDCHFTEVGAQLVARKIADWFLAHPP